MKTMIKTFDELVLDLQEKAGRNFFMKEEVTELMMKVRQSTINECREAIRKEHKTYEPFSGGYYQPPLGEQIYNINNLKNDRIKIKNGSR